MRRDYWIEAVWLALEEAGVKATDEQIAEIAACLEVSRENEGLALGCEHIPHPLEAKLRDSRRQHLDELAVRSAEADALREEIERLRRDVRFWANRSWPS